MNHRDPPPPPPPNLRHTTTSQILKQTTSLFYSNLLTFLFLSSLIFTFRSNVHTAFHYLSSFIDHNPSLKSLFDVSASSSSPHLPQHLRHPNPQPPYRRRRSPFLHLSRVGTLDDDFFSGDADFDRSLFHPSSTKPTANATFAIPSDFDSDHSFAKAAFKPDFNNFRVEFRRNATLLEGENRKFKKTMSGDRNEALDLDFLFRGFELGHHYDQENENTLLFLAGVLSAAYAYVVSAYIVTYAWANGIVFLKVVDHLVGNRRSFFRTVWDGSSTGLKKLSGFILMKWAVRDTLAQLLGIVFFGEIEDHYVLYKVFLRMKLLPFANVAPWVRGYEWDSAGFIVMWFLSDLILGFVFAVDSWVAIVESRRSGRDIVKEGCHLLVTLFGPAFEIRLLEAIVCGSFGRWVLRRVLGDLFAIGLQSLMEVYFLVGWSVFYFAARHKDDESVGRTFGQQELEGFLEVFR